MVIIQLVFSFLLKYLHKLISRCFLGTKLKANVVVSALAAQIYHRFYEAASEINYDPFVIINFLTLFSCLIYNDFVVTQFQLVAATSLYIASKQQDEPIKIRDLINVVHRTLNRDSEVLDLNEEYWSYRDSIVQAELLAMRMISFKSTRPDTHLVAEKHSMFFFFSADNNHKFIPFHIQYLLNYLKTLESWIPPSVWEKVPLTKFCWTVLNDFHHCKAIIHYEPQLLALSVIFFGLQVYGVTVPCTTEHDQFTWHEVCSVPSFIILISLRGNLYRMTTLSFFLSQTFHASAKKEDIWAVVEKIMDFYEQDKGQK